ncbi:MAG: ComF family protein [Phycisphaerae bacterium]|nr:ComF family protein [Phycisphaerae bacterium]
MGYRPFAHLLPDKGAQQQEHLQQAIQFHHKGQHFDAIAILDKYDLATESPEHQQAYARCYVDAAKMACHSQNLAGARRCLARAVNLGCRCWYVNKRLELISAVQKGRGRVAPKDNWINEVKCNSCDKENPGPLVCVKCRGGVTAPSTEVLREDVAEIYALGVYRWKGDVDAANALSRVIRLMKKDEVNRLCESLGYLLVTALRQDTSMLKEADVLASVPPDPERWRERGFDNVACLTSYMEKFALVPLISDILVKTRATPDLRQLSRSARRDALTGSIQVYGRHSKRISGAVVLIVDDVVTSGVTLDVCAKAFLAAGARKVIGATLAKSESS